MSGPREIRRLKVGDRRVTVESAPGTVVWVPMSVATDVLKLDEAELRRHFMLAERDA
jgi:hypothetical protein